MKRVSVAVALLLVFGATAAQADRWVSSKKLPKPVDYPIVRKNVRESHKQGKHQNHPEPRVGNLGALAGSTRTA